MTFEQWKATCKRVPSLRDLYGPAYEIEGPGLAYGVDGDAGYINENPDGTYTLELPMQEIHNASASELEPQLYAFIAGEQGWITE